MSDFSIEKNFVYSTTDGGVTWVSYSLPSDFSKGEGLYFFDPMNGFAFGRKIYKTSDGGQTWIFVQEVFWSGQFGFINANHDWASVMNGSNLNALVETGNGNVHWDMYNPMVIP